MRTLTKMLTLGVAVFIAACDSNSSDPISPPPPVETATIQVLHASPDAPPVNVILDGTEVLSDVDYKASSGWGEIDVGTYSVQVDGLLPSGGVTVIGPVDLTFAADTVYTIAAVNAAAALEPALWLKVRCRKCAGFWTMP